jgi:hypothetical protein
MLEEKFLYTPEYKIIRNKTAVQGLLTWSQLKGKLSKSCQPEGEHSHFPIAKGNAARP